MPFNINALTIAEQDRFLDVFSDALLYEFLPRKEAIERHREKVGEAEFIHQARVLLPHHFWRI